MKLALILFLIVLLSAPSVHAEKRQDSPYQNAINLRCSELTTLSSTRHRSIEDEQAYQNAALWLHGYYSGRNEAVITHSEQEFQVELIAITAQILCDEGELGPFISDSYDVFFQEE